MKKLIFLFLALGFFAPTFSQSKNQSYDFTYGAHASIASNNVNLGVGIRGELSILDNISIVPQFTYFLGKKYSYINWETTYRYWSLECDGHYFFTDQVYGLAGLAYNASSYKSTINSGYLGYGNKTSGSDGEVGINFGVGATLNVDTLKPFAEVKYNTGFSVYIITAGLTF